MNEKRFITIDHSTCVFDKITKEEYVCIDREEAFLVCKRLNAQQDAICKLEQRDYYNQSERYKILCRAIELTSEYIHRNDLEYYDFCALITEFEKELLDDGK